VKRSQTILIATVVIGVIGSIYAMNMKAREDRQKLSEAMAVSVLPMGTEAAWVAYVDKRVSEAIQRDGDTLRVAAIMPQTTYVSPNTPYQVHCWPNLKLGTSVTFGGTGAAITVPIFGVMAARRGTPQPSLGVSSSSIAAANLSEKLCRRIVTYMQTVMTEPGVAQPAS